MKFGVRQFIAAFSFVCPDFATTMPFSSSGFWAAGESGLRPRKKAAINRRTPKGNIMRTTLLLLCLFAQNQTFAADGYRLSGRSPLYVVPPQRALDLSDEVTLEAWLRADPMDAGGGRILDKAPPGTSEAFTLDTYPGNSLRFGTLNGHIQYDARLGADRWRHVAAVYSASKKIQKLYLDGREVASAGHHVPMVGGGRYPALSTTTEPLCLGADPQGGNRFHGRILRAAIYRRALSAEEIGRRAAALAPAPLDGVLGEWLLTEKPGRKIAPVAGTLVLQNAAIGFATVFEGRIHGEAPPPEEPLSLWYRRPAVQWTEALPIGNGRLGGMVFGGIDSERIQLNEDTLWAGGPYDPNNAESAKLLPEARRLIFAGQVSRGEQPRRLADDGPAAGTDAVPDARRSAAPVPRDEGSGELPPRPEPRHGHRHDELHGRRRPLHARGICQPCGRVIVVRLTADKPGQISFTAGLKTPHKATVYDS